MLELAVAAAIAVVLIVSAAGEGAVRLLFAAGGAAVALGLAAGIPAGVGYHVALHRALAALGAVERGWWWRPTSYHARLPAAARAVVMPWFRAGAAGFAVTLAGCALVLAAVLAQ